MTAAKRSGNPIVWILLVSPDPDRRLAFRAILEQAGFGVEFSNCGDITVTRARNCYYDLIVLDMPAGVTEGVTTTITIRSIERERGQVNTPILAVVGPNSNGASDECRRAGVDDILETPVATVQLVRHIERLVSMK